MKISKGLILGLGLAASLGFAGTSWAGPVIIDGTDANDHGSASATVNNNGWLYMQKALENLAGAVDASVAKVVLSLGTTGAGGNQTSDAIISAFAKSSLPGSGWSLTHVGGAGIAAALAGLGTASTGILYIPTAGNTSGDLSDANLGIINAASASIAAFVNGPGDPTKGGGLFSMGESPGSGATAYGWLTAVIPGITVTDIGGGGTSATLSLTAAGSSAFPGLTNGDLNNATPWHNHFGGNLGSLSVLATAANPTRNVIIGGGAGTVIVDVPEPGTILLFAFGLLGLGVMMRRRATAI